MLGLTTFPVETDGARLAPAAPALALFAKDAERLLGEPSFAARLPGGRDRVVVAVGRPPPRGRPDLRPGQGVLQLPLAGVRLRGDRREIDVGFDAAALDPFAVHPEILGDGELQSPGAPVRGEVDDVLDGSLPEGPRPDHDAPSVVLDGPGQDLRGGRAAAVDEHPERSAPRHRRILVPLDLGAARRTADLDDRTGLDEQARDLEGLVQGSALVVPDVHDQRVDALLAQLPDEPADVPARAPEVVPARRPARDVEVEGGNVDDADPRGRAVAGPRLQDPPGGGLVVEVDAVADEGERTGRSRRGARGEDPEVHGAALRAADEVHHVLEPPAHDVRHLALVGLAHADDPVVHPELAASVGRTSGDDAAHDGVLPHRLQGGSDSLEREAHPDPEVLRRSRREILAVRVDGSDVRIEEVLNDVVRVDLVHPPGHARIPGVQGFRYRFRIVPGELEFEDVVLDPPPPVVIEGRGAPGPGRVAAVELELLFAREVEVAGGELRGVPRPVPHAQPVAVEHLEREVEATAAQGVVDTGPVEVEIGDVAGEEHAVARVEDLEVAVEDAGAELVVERDLAVVVTAHDLDDGPGRPGVRGRGPDLLRPRRPLLRGAGAGARQHGGQQRGRRERAAHALHRPASSARRFREVSVHQNAFRTSSTICLASPNSIIVLSRKNSSFSTPA